ncbi:MAG: hypothetical protein WCI46_07555, partial [Verrucomicrobiota bacterium]
MNPSTDSPRQRSSIARRVFGSLLWGFFGWLIPNLAIAILAIGEPDQDRYWWLFPAYFAASIREVRERLTTKLRHGRGA